MGENKNVIDFENRLFLHLFVLQLVFSLFTDANRRKLFQFLRQGRNSCCFVYSHFEGWWLENLSFFCLLSPNLCGWVEVACFIEFEIFYALSNQIDAGMISRDNGLYFQLFTVIFFSVNRDRGLVCSYSELSLYKRK